ncbi:cytochrome c1 [Agrobacterium rubi]|uniref:Cytochrome c1 n=2 Tax=Agrobacterium rubi TaxID=28099 RepID=A0AAE7R4R0_9HYPH|nr:cytochrome c1 [Agrobacterium rubi]MBP1877099.1 ubiquinol-cytochrome c reductase cytochrome c1 subunit [Agrobacterium rubi]MCL6651284.1 ribosomal protein P2 [Agrobacterium rubi]NTE86958.1 cytochrome c1 [Agrobacterium rubi]NTF02892.1 cytochrome c1 [Agrobacterium rubi]NTF37136.1 cytochrome c1 [Agrobacterium rubi]
MKKLVTSIALIAVMGGFSSAVQAAEESHDLKTQAEHAIAGGHFPILKPHEEKWSFAGPFGKYDKAQLQRGLKVYKEVCSACHSMSLVSFRTLEDMGYSEDQVKAFAAEYEVQDGPNADGEMFTRKAVPSDHFPSPYPNHEAAAAANGGAAPPDMSLLAKARGVERGFPQFLIDMIPVVGGYQEGGPDYIHALLNGYQNAPEGIEVAEGTHFNPYFASASALKMAPPISADQVTYDDGSPQTVEQYSHDVAAFLMWAAEPHLEERKRTGFMVIVFLLIFTALIYLTKKSVYSRKEH